MSDLPKIIYHKNERMFETNVTNWELGLYTLVIIDHLIQDTPLFEGTLKVEPDPRSSNVLNGRLADDKHPKVAVVQLRHNAVPTRHAVLARGDTYKLYEGKGINTAFRSIMATLYRKMLGGQTLLTYIDAPNHRSTAATLYSVDVENNTFFATTIKALRDEDGNTKYDQVEITQNVKKPATLDEQQEIFKKIQRIFA